MNMKATDIVNKVELDVTYDSLIELMRAGRQVDFVLPAPETDGDGYLTWDTEYWTTVDNKRLDVYKRQLEPRTHPFGQRTASANALYLLGEPSG